MNIIQNLLNQGREAAREITMDARFDRADHCGKWVSYFSADNSVKVVVYHCNMFRICKACLARRVQEVRERVSRAMNVATESRKRIFTFATDNAEEESLVLNRIRYRDIEYLRLPTGEGKATFFIEANASERAAFHEFGTTYVESEDQFLQEEWQMVCRTPEGLRTSGNLGKPEEKEKEEEDTISFEVQLVHTDANIAERKSAEAKAFEAVPAMKYDTLDEGVIEFHQEQLFLRTAAYIAALKELGKVAYILTSFNERVEICKLLNTKQNPVTSYLQNEAVDIRKIVTETAKAFWDQV